MLPQLVLARVFGGPFSAVAVGAVAPASGSAAVAVVLTTPVASAAASVAIATLARRGSDGVIENPSEQGVGADR